MIVAGGIDWGNAPQWVSGVLGAASVLLALTIIFRDRRKEERSQASQVSCWKRTIGHEAAYRDDPLHFKIVVTATNNSGMPITRPTVMILGTLTLKEANKPAGNFGLPEQVQQYGQRDSGNFQAKNSFLDDAGSELSALLPSGSATLTLTLHKPSHFYHMYLYFGDSQNRFWLRNINSGKLLKTSAVTE